MYTRNGQYDVKAKVSRMGKTETYYQSSPVFNAPASRGGLLERFPQYWRKTSTSHFRNGRILTTSPYDYSPDLTHLLELS